MPLGAGIIGALALIGGILLLRGRRASGGDDGAEEGAGGPSPDEQPGEAGEPTDAGDLHDMFQAESGQGAQRSQP